MFHEELQKEEKANYPTIREILVENYSKDYPKIGDSNIRAEERGNQGYGFHVTLPGSKVPDFFFKIERELKAQPPEEIAQLKSVHKLMEKVHDKARDSEDRGVSPDLDSAKLIGNKSGEFVTPLSNAKIPTIPNDLLGHSISLQTSIGGSKLPLKEKMLQSRQLSHYDKRFERDRGMSIDVNPANLPDRIVEKMARTLGALHNEGQEGKEKRRPITNTVHNDAHPDNFLYKEEQRKEENGKERIIQRIIPIDLEDLSRGPRVEDLELMIGQTKIDHNALRPGRNINPMGDKINERTTAAIIRGYDEVSRLTGSEIKKLSESKSVNADMRPIIQETRKQTLNALDLEVKPGQLERIASKETKISLEHFEYGKASAGPTSKDGVPLLSKENRIELEKIKSNLKDSKIKPEENNSVTKKVENNINPENKGRS
jgi:hypothetical protein